MKILKMTVLAVSISVAFSTGAMAQALSQDEYKAAVDRISAEYAAGEKTCDSLAGNAKDVCMAQIKGRERIANAELDARQEPTREKKRDALVVKADAEYAVASEKCDALAGNAKDVCMKEAKAAEVRAKTDADAQYKISNANETAAEKTDEASAEARKETAEAGDEAAADRREANYDVAKGKCDALAGEAKDACVESAKMKYGE